MLYSNLAMLPNLIPISFLRAIRRRVTLATANHYETKHTPKRLNFSVETAQRLDELLMADFLLNNNSLASSKSLPADCLQKNPIGEIYVWLRRLSISLIKRERIGHTLQPTALANEVMLLLWKNHGEALKNLNHGHLKRFAAVSARRVLVDHARKKLRLKRGGEHSRVKLHEGMLGEEPAFEVTLLDSALVEFSELYPKEAELVQLRFWGGMTQSEIASELGWSERTTARRWTFAKAWLQKRMKEFFIETP